MDNRVELLKEKVEAQKMLTIENVKMACETLPKAIDTGNPDFIAQGISNLLISIDILMSFELTSYEAIESYMMKFGEKNDKDN